MQPFILALSRKQPSGNRRTAEQDEQLAPIAISHEIGRPLDCLLRGPARRYPQISDEFVQHGISQPRDLRVPREQESQGLQQVLGYWRRLE
jgi:hypothetical protein